MKTTAIVLLTIASLCSGSTAEQNNPLGTVLDLISSVEAKIVKEGEDENKAFKEFFQWCDEAAKNVNYEIKTAQSSKEKLTAKIGQMESDILAATTKIEDLAAQISTNGKELSEATAIRSKEADEFYANENELMASVDTLERAHALLQRQMATSPATLAQMDTSNMANLIHSMSLVVQAAGFSTEDHKRLVGLVQGRNGEAEDTAMFGAPAAAAYKSHSSNILDVLEDLKDDAESTLATARKAEAQARHNYNAMRQSLEDEMAADRKDLDERKADKAYAGEEKATAEGDLAVTVKDLEQSKNSRSTANENCMTSASDHEATLAARTQELKVLAEVKEVLTGSTGAAKRQTYSLIQVATFSRLHTSADLASSEVLNAVKKLAKTHHSVALAQLASRISVVMKFGAQNGAEPFAKVKSLLSDMISKLKQEAESETTEKAYCDEQMAETDAKKEELGNIVAKLTSKIDQTAARSASIKQEVAELSAELLALAKSQAEITEIRQEEAADFKVAKAELEEGLAGVRKAMSLLHDYYGAASMLQEDSDAQLSDLVQQPKPPEQHEKASGAGSTILSILEVVVSDFATNLAKEESQESDATAEFEKTTQENKITQAAKEADVKFKTREAASLDKLIAEQMSDRETSHTELSAVLEYFGKIKERCVAKAESYEERVARRESEVAGLREAADILDNQMALMQRKSHATRGRFLQLRAEGHQGGVLAM